MGWVDEWTCIVSTHIYFDLLLTGPSHSNSMIDELYTDHARM